MRIQGCFIHRSLQFPFASSFVLNVFHLCRLCFWTRLAILAPIFLRFSPLLILILSFEGKIMVVLLCSFDAAFLCFDFNDLIFSTFIFDVMRSSPKSHHLFFSISFVVVFILSVFFFTDVAFSLFFFGCYSFTMFFGC